MARLRYAGGNWDVRPLAARRLLWEVTKRTSIESRAKEPVVTLRDAALYRTPFLYLTGDDAFSPWSADEIANLRRYLSRGGFLFVDDATGTLDSAFDASVRRELKRVFSPERPLAVLPRDARERDAGALPDVVVVDLGHRGADAVGELRLDRAHVQPLLLQRVRLREEQLGREDADVARTHVVAAG